MAGRAPKCCILFWILVIRHPTTAMEKPSEKSQISARVRSTAPKEVQDNQPVATGRRRGRGGYGRTRRPPPPCLLLHLLRIPQNSPPLLLAHLPVLLVVSSPWPPQRRPCSPARRRWRQRRPDRQLVVSRGAVPELHHLDMERDARELPCQRGGPARAARPRLRRLRRALAQASKSRSSTAYM